MKRFSAIRFLLSGVLITITISASAQAGNDTKSNTLFKGHVYTFTPENTTYAPVWDTIKIEDVAWIKKTWRTIDLSQKENEWLNLTSVHPSIGDVLLNGLYSGQFPAHHIFTDDRFVDVFTPEMIMSLKASGVQGNAITSLKIKESWIYVISKKELVVHIIGIAPVVKDPGGEEKTLFWAYYPDAREYFSKQLVSAPGTSPGTLDEVFEGRFFSSKIDKVTEQIIEPHTGGPKW